MVVINIVCNILDYFVYVSTLVGEFVIVSQIYCLCPKLFVGFKTWVYLIIQDMLNFDVILGITRYLNSMLF